VACRPDGTGVVQVAWAHGKSSGSCPVKLCNHNGAVESKNLKCQTDVTERVQYEYAEEAQIGDALEGIFTLNTFFTILSVTFFGILGYFYGTHTENGKSLYSTISDGKVEMQ